MIDQHYMSPSAVFIVLMTGFALDWSSFGPDGWRDKIAMLFYTAGIREGFNGGAIDAWCVDMLSKIIDFTKEGGNTYLSGAVSSKIIGGFVGVTILYAVFCLLPPWKWISKKIGPAGRLNFPKGNPYKINWPIVGVSAVIGLMTDLCGGVVGGVANPALNMLCSVLGVLPDMLFGG